LTARNKDEPRFEHEPAMPSERYVYRSSQCRAHENRYAERKVRERIDDAEDYERDWHCVGCLIGAQTLPSSGDGPAEDSSLPSQSKSRRRRRARAVLAAGVGRPPLIAEPLRLAIIAEESAS